MECRCEVPKSRSVPNEALLPENTGRYWANHLRWSVSRRLDLIMLNAKKTKSPGKSLLEVACVFQPFAYNHYAHGIFTSSFRPTDTTPTLVIALSLKRHRGITRDEKLGACTVDMRVNAAPSEGQSSARLIRLVVDLAITALAIPLVNERGTTVVTCFVAVDVTSADPTAHTPR